MDMSTIVPIVIGIILTGSLGATGYFVKKKFDKIDTLCRTINRLEQALLKIPCVANFLKTND